MQMRINQAGHDIGLAGVDDLCPGSGKKLFEGINGGHLCDTPILNDDTNVMLKSRGTFRAGNQVLGQNNFHRIRLLSEYLIKCKVSS